MKLYLNKMATDKVCMDYTHLTDDTSISEQLKYPDQLDPEDVTTPASLHVLQRESGRSGSCLSLRTSCDRKCSRQ